MSFQGLVSVLSRLTLSRRVAVFLTVAAVLSCLATYVVLTKRSNDVGAVYWLLNLDLVLLLLIGTVISHQVVRLWSERKRGIAGSKLHVRLVFIFGILAATPAILMAIFSSIFLYFGLHGWFNDRVSTAIHESLEVAQAYLREHQQVMRADVLAMANDLNRAAAQLSGNQEAFSEYVQTQSQLRNLPEAIVVTSNGKTLARSRLSLSLELDHIPQKVLESAQKGEVVLMTGDGRDRIRALLSLDRFFDSYLYVGRLVDASVLAHIQTAENAVKEYTTLQGKKMQLQVSATGMFIAVALILLLGAIWFGLVFAEQLVLPIGALIVAAERIRAGDLDVRVPESRQDDEIGLLGKVFNRMTGQIKEQRDELVAANRMLETVLSGASSGVLGLDENGVITLANWRARELLLGDGGREFGGARLADLIPEAESVLRQAHESANKQGSLQLELSRGEDGPRRAVLLQVTVEQGGEGAVATIDDISTLVSAQRKAAWADVARRIAHEIKNPLTPIQLSAERLKRKYLPQIVDDPDTFAKCTETIIRQVNEIGHMVGEFSAYARMPVAVKRQENIIEVCQDALVLQQHSHPDITFDFIAAESVIAANCDRSQLTQVITNLLQNAIDSIHERQQQSPGEGHIRLLVDQKGDNISIILEDNGTGLSEKIKDHLMEPYVTTKKKGSGLGLAIAKKIMEEHDGSVVLEDSVRQDTVSGAKATIVFPRGIHALKNAG